MKYGHCKTCWWHKDGQCYMHYVKTRETSYCPDHINRQKENKLSGETLNEWIKKNKDKFNRI